MPVRPFSSTRPGWRAAALVTTAAALAMAPAAARGSGPGTPGIGAAEAPAFRDAEVEAFSPAPAALHPGPGPATPGMAPWSQGVEYRIEARLDEGDEVLRGRMRLRYHNASPDTLRRFYLHLHLNAFRPNSAWARRDLEHGIRTFQELGPDEHAFERISSARFDGLRAEPEFPGAPDSTVARFTLPEPLPPGDTVTLDLDWTARPSTVPRRQGRRGRQYDFAQWYPRVAPYDLEGWAAHPLYRQGEFYGEFATYDVTLDVREDQVIGATGVPVDGDPGWESAAAPGVESVDHQRNWYGAVGGPPCIERRGERICGVPPADLLPREEPLDLLRGAAPEGRKRVRWRAEDVHHFAWSASPDYIYEEGSFEDVAIRVLYRPGDEEEWGDGVAVRRTAVALAWLDSIFGDYAWPQLTNLHRIEGGGTEFPMVIMDGSASQGLIVHEAGHQYAHGMLANNEWAEGWLDEGLSSFQTSWFFEEAADRGRRQWLGAEVSVLLSDLRGDSEPVVLPAEDYPEYAIYSRMIYTKGSLVFRMLRDMAGRDRFVELLRTYFERHAPGHVDTDAFREVAEEVLRRDLDWFFGEWLHGTGVVDYALEGVDARPAGSGEWKVEVTVERKGDLVMPVPLRVSGEGASVDTVVPGTSRRTEARLRVGFEPERVELSPRGEILDWNALNDVWEPGILPATPRDVELDDPLSREPARRDALRTGWLPLAWHNDAGGVTLGVQARTNYMGSLHRTLLRIGAPAFEADALDAGEGGDGGDPGSVYLRAEDPILLGRPRFGLRGEALVGEGRAAVLASWSRDASRFPVSGPRRSRRAFASVVGTYDDGYLRPLRWDIREGITVEGGVGWRLRSSRRRGTGGVGGGYSVDLSLAGGFTNGGKEYGRLAVEAGLSGRPAERLRLGARLFAGGVETRGSDDVPRERLFFLSGAGPYDLLGNPLLRSAGATLARSAGWYHAPGGGGLRGYHPTVGADGLAALNAEAGVELLRGGPVGVEVAGFADVGWAALSPEAASGPGSAAGACGAPTPLPAAPDPGTPCLAGTDGERLLADAGVGVRIRPGEAPFRLRVDLPLWVSDPLLAAQERGGETGLRATVSFAPAVGF